MKFKLWFMFLVVLVIMILVSMRDTGRAEVRDFSNNEYVITVGTVTPVRVGGYLPGRRYYLVVNESLTYDVRHATFPIIQTDIQTTTSGRSKGKRLSANYGYWEDMYNVYQSSWFILVSSDGAPATSAPITAPVYYYERN